MNPVRFAPLVFFLVSIGGGAASAQFPIPIPKIPKITVEKQESANTGSTANQQETNGAVQATTSPPSQDMWEGADFRLKSFRDKLISAQKVVGDYTPETKTTLAMSPEVDWVWRAISKKERDDFFSEWGSLMKPPVRTWFEAETTRLSEIASQKIPTTKPPKIYALTSPADERMIRARLAEDLPGVAMHRSLLAHSVWQYQTNNLGVPVARYKWGMIWGKNPNADDAYCRYYYVNVIQDYAGAGTYGQTYAKWTTSEIAGCPAAK